MMRHLRLSLLIAGFSTSFFCPSAIAAAFQLYELGTPVIGTAAVGQAVVSDASTAYLNPAGMTALPTSELMVGTQMLLPYINFSKRPNTIFGDNGGNAGVLTPSAGIYYVYRYSPCLDFGMSFASPYGGFLSYNNGWTGRYVVQYLQFYALNFNPAIAYRINHWAAIGAGVSLEYASLHQETATPLRPDVDGQINIKVDNWAPGFNLGLLFTPTETTKIGIAYRSKINHNLHGDVTFLRIQVHPNVSTRLIYPNNVILSLSQALSNKFNLLAELGWAHWSTMRSTTVDLGRIAISTPQDWTNTYRIGLGAQIQYLPCLLMQLGTSYDSSPTSSGKRLPNLPMDRQIRIGLGSILSLSQAIQLGFSYEYINLGKANINNTSRIGTLSGSYSRDYMNVFQISLNVAT